MSEIYIYIYIDENNFLTFVQDLDSMTPSRFRVRVFAFKSASLVLNRVPTCVRKPKTFDESTGFLHELFLVV